MKRVFNLQKNVNEVTLTLDYEDYINLMATLKTSLDYEESKGYANTKNLKEIIELIETIEPEFIWDEI